MATEPLQIVMIDRPDGRATRETWVQHLHKLMRLPRNTMLRDLMIRSTRETIAEIDRHTADPSRSEIYDVLMDPVGPADTRERWEQHLRGLMRLPRDMLGRKEMIIRARPSTSCWSNAQEGRRRCPQQVRA